MIDIPYEGHTIRAYLATPEGEGQHPGVVVVQEWWGLNQQICDTAERFAAEGYVALAPDLYEGNVTEEPAEAGQFKGRYEGQAHDKALAAYEALRARDDVQKVGAIGWCRGGRVALRVAMRQPQLDACVTFYGSPDPSVDDVATIRSPVLGLYGEADESIPVARVEEVDRELDAANVTHEVVIYPGAAHAFFNETRAHRYQPEAAQDAWERTLAFFGQHLA